MSFSNPTLRSPAEYKYTWSGSKGELQWYDKEAKESVAMDLPFEFIVLDELAAVRGYNKKLGSGFWSNEVRDIRSDDIYVKTQSGAFEAGLYANLTQTRTSGGKYCQVIYIAHEVEGEWCIGKLEATGSFLGAWFDFKKKIKSENNVYAVAQGAEATSPVGNYFPPVFSERSITNEENGIAYELDKKLQVYLSQYLSAPKVDDDGYGTPEPEVGKATPEQQKDFEERRSAGRRKPEPIIEDIGDEPINLDDIPF